MWSERKPLQEKSVLMRAGDSPLFICFPPQPISVVLPPLFLWFFPHLFLLLCSLFSPREGEAFTDKDFHILKQYSSWLSQVHSFLCLTDLHVFLSRKKKNFTSFLTAPLSLLFCYFFAASTSSCTFTHVSSPTPERWELHNRLQWTQRLSWFHFQSFLILTPSISGVSPLKQ